MSKTFRNDLTGQRFGRLTVLEFVPNGEINSYWKCQCDCGNILITRADALRSGKAKSCGCWNREIAKKTAKAKTKHGKRDTRLYRIWAGMKARCYNKNNRGYKHYGGRGIIMCDEWKNDFQVFYDWAMANGYSDNLTIDRIDVNGNYCPENCRWATNETQKKNMRTNIVVEYKGTRMCLTEAAERSGINGQTLFSRYQVGNRGERLFRPVRKYKK